MVIAADHAVVRLILALIQRGTGMMRQREAARDAEIESTRRELKTARALNDSELAFAKTRPLADRYATRLATLGHDLSQPLAALRLTFGKALNDVEAICYNGLLPQSSFHYLAELIKRRWYV